jgi:S-formylglutathione hydrolase
METLSESCCFGGKLGTYRHRSAANGCDMRFSVYQPPQAARGPVPVVTYLAGLTCNEETFMQKAGAQRVAAELGLMLVAPDTSPRGEGVPDDPDGAWDFGLGAGFYLNATQEPWRQNYRMYDYLTRDLPLDLFTNFAADPGRQGIMGHSMGGHGALTVGLKNPGTYASISAFAPICSPVNCPWGEKALTNYLGADRSSWAAYDATELVKAGDVKPAHRILIDQGEADQFLKRELHPHLFAAACTEHGVALELRRHPAYDHGYYFIASFMEDHLRFHAAILKS